MTLVHTPAGRCRGTHLFLVAFLTCLLSASAYADLATDYAVAQSTGSYASISSGTTLIAGSTNSTNGTFDESANSGTQQIGFTFYFNGQSYTQFSASTSGVVYLGTGTSGSYSNDLTNAPAYPILAPYWQHQHMYNGGTGCSISPSVDVVYSLSGTKPNRVLTIDFRTQLCDATGTYYWSSCTNPMNRYEVKLFEGSNHIQFIYGQIYTGLSTSASIGVADGASDFISITPGSPATISTTTANNSISMPSNPLSNGTMFEFIPCGITIAGRTGVGNGGTANAADGDTLFTSVRVTRGSTGAFTPISLQVPDYTVCGTRDYLMSISGTAAGEYTFSNGTQTMSGSVSVGTPVVPTINFKPSTVGYRDAILTVSDQGNHQTWVYHLQATGDPRIQWSGTVAQGGTPNLLMGDTLMKNVIVLRHDSAFVTPITLTNTNSDPTADPLQAQITYTIDDPTGQYVITPTSDAIAGGESSQPTIAFRPTIAGPQYATLTVNADGEVRTYVLAAFSSAPAGEFLVNGQRLSFDVGLFSNTNGCVGEGAMSIPMVVKNTGSGDLIINAFDLYETDTTIRQGTPPYPLRYDGLGRPIPMSDYYVTTQANVPASRLSLPITIPEGNTVTYYITFNPSRTNKRFGRAFVQTNAQNFTGLDVSGDSVEGDFNFGVYARGVGATVSADPTGQKVGPILFQNRIRVGDSVDQTVTWFNTGDCNLKVNLDKVGIDVGDVQDFRLISAFGRTISPKTPLSGEAIIGPDSSMTLTVRFLPQRAGSRRATLIMPTNDSSLGTPFAGRGVYRIDVYGQGQAGLDFVDVNFPPTIIGDTSSREVDLFNSSRDGVEILQLALVGADSAQFGEDAALAWPTLPKTIPPGGELRLGVIMFPNGVPGIRNAKLRVTLTTGEVFDVGLRGEGGVETLVVSPTSLFSTAKPAIGTTVREQLAITNTGTLPLSLQQPMVTGVDSADYEVTPLKRLSIDPGATELVEVSFTPDAARSYAATMTINSSAGSQVVTLGGTGVGISRVEDAVTAAGLESAMLTPNPAAGQSDIVWEQSRSANVLITLFDATGRRVAEVYSGTETAGSHRASIDVSSLASGTYVVQLQIGSAATSRHLVVMR